jgi:hypothetical protein
MASATSTDLLRVILAIQFRDSLVVTGATTALFGDQGHTDDGVPKAALPTQTSLYHALIQVNVDLSDISLEGHAVRVTGRLPIGTLTGSTISEFAVALNGTLIGIRNSVPKVKDADEEFTTSMLFLF